MLSCKKHPIARLCDIAEMSISDMTQCFVVILQGRESRVCTGVTSCDFRDATLLFFRPGECQAYVERMKCQKGVLALCFCGDWLERTLVDAFSLSYYSWQKQYGFFEYNIKESLHLSLREKAAVEKCLNDIKDEMEWGLDDYSNMLIAQKIKMFFDYCCRYYERQHITRSCLNQRLMTKIEQAVDEYLVSGDNCLTCCHVPIHRFAFSLGLSDAYFLDFLKRETGKSLDKYVCARHFDVAKHLLLSTDMLLVEIARKLGYSSVQSFSTTFKRVVGCAPSDYRNVN